MKQSTGHTSTQSVHLQRMQLSLTMLVKSTIWGGRQLSSQPIVCPIRRQPPASWKEHDQFLVHPRQPRGIPAIDVCFWHEAAEKGEAERVCSASIFRRRFARKCVRRRPRSGVVGSRTKTCTQRRIETRLPATRYFWPISPRGEERASTFLIVVSGMLSSCFREVGFPG